MLYEQIFKEFGKAVEESKNSRRDILLREAQEQNIEGIIGTLNAHFASIPCRLYLSAKNEAFYQSNVFSFIDASSLEISSSLGYQDINLTVGKTTYVLEAKHNKSALEAIQQGLEKKYIHNHLKNNRDVVLIGLNFVDNSRNIDDWQAIKYNQDGEVQQFWNIDGSPPSNIQLY